MKRPPVESQEGNTPALGDHLARALLEAPERVSVKGKRDRAILATLLYHALRRDELCKLTVKDFRHEWRGVAHLKALGKGSKTRYVPLHPAACGPILDYQEADGRGMAPGTKTTDLNAGSAMGASGDRAGSRGSTGPVGAARNDTRSSPATGSVGIGTPTDSKGSMSHETPNSSMRSASSSKRGGTMDKSKRRSAAPSSATCRSASPSITTPGTSSNVEPPNMPAERVK